MFSSLSTGLVPPFGALHPEFLRANNIPKSDIPACPAWYTDCVAFARHTGNFDKIGMCTHNHQMDFMKKYRRIEIFCKFVMNPQDHINEKLVTHEPRALEHRRKADNFVWLD